MLTTEFLIVGGGIAGASVGYELAAHGSVVLVEREKQFGYHTTGRSAALLTEAWESPLIRSITAAGRDFFEEPPFRFTDVPLVSPRPIMLIGSPDQRAAVDASAEEARSQIPSVRLIDGGEASELSPVLRPGYVDRAVLEPDGRAIDVDNLLQGFLRGIRRRHGQVLTDSPVSAIARDGAGWSVQAGSENIRAEALVNAAGSWADQIAALAGIEPMGLQPKRRTAFTFAPPEGADVRRWPAVIDIDEQFYFEPEGVQLLGSPADQTPMDPHDVRHDEIDVAIGIERIQAATTLEIRSIRRAWAGLRTFAPDGAPVVGPDPEDQQFVWLAGQGGFGIMTSPGMARMATSLIIDGELPAWMANGGVREAEVRPDRLRP
jgi:D-arginine dehydrogenase